MVSIASQFSIAIFNSLDIWTLLLRNYEFRFMSALNATNWAILAIIFSDIRALSCVSMWSVIQIIIAMDASIQTSRHGAKAAAMSIPLMLAVAVACSFALVPGGNFFTVHIPGLVVQGRNVAVFTSTTLSVFLAKKAIVTYWMLRQQADQTPAIPCAVLIGWLRFELVGVKDADSSRVATDQSKEQPGTRQLKSFETQLRLAGERSSIFDTRRTLTSHLWPTVNPLPREAQPFIWGSAAVGLASTVCAWVMIFTCPALETVSCVVGVVALVCTDVVANALAGFYCQRELLLENTRNFDLIFSGFQQHIFALCLCDLFQWRPHLCFAVLSWWIWFFMVVLLDSLTPASRRQLGLRKRHALPVSLFALLVPAVVTVALATESYKDVLVDRALVSIALNGEIKLEMRTGELALQRAVTMLVWSLRVPLALATSQEDELMFVRDHVEYFSSLPAVGSQTVSVTPVTTTPH